MNVRINSRSILSLVSGTIAVSLIFVAPLFAEKKKEKNKHSDSKHLEQQMHREEDAIKGEIKKEKDKIVAPGSHGHHDAHNVFSVQEKNAIFGYYKVQNQNLPPGLAKKVAKGGSLPPGWQKKVSRGEVMPLDVYKHAEPLPKDIIIQLPSVAPGTSLMKIDNRIVKVVDATKTIIDVIDLP